MVRIDKRILLQITEADKERNIYVHPLPLARDIFWQRLEYAFKYLKTYTKQTDNVLDFGGGSGVFSKSLCSYFDDVFLIDIDTKDAANIKEYFALDNLSVITDDITTYKSKMQYDIIIATDVLEHFEDLQEPLNFFKRFLKREGLLLVTLPTENKLYEIGRKIINKSKPKDHYHTSKNVLDFLLQNGFMLIKKEYLPKYFIPIPLFEIALLQFKDSDNAV